MRQASRPLSVKFALLTAAVGAGVAAPAHAGFVSSVPAGYTPQTFDWSHASTFGIDLDANGTTDFTIDANGSSLIINGTNSRDKVATFWFDADFVPSLSSFVSANSLKGLQSAAVVDPALTGSFSNQYLELVFVNQNDALNRGYLQASVDGTARSLTLTDYGMETPLATGDVPEPDTLALLAAGAVGIGALRRRRAARAL